ncbi:PBP1A family penicillin-binding protein, partial [Desulfovibrio sp. OttesenSCG-928-A18]|nr:PBP1A family penicillin-binding protein [Desulfovibrio sp. OttesenSCG-928-A18]
MKRFFHYLLLGLTSLGILGAFALVGLYLYISKDLPSITKVSDYRAPQVTTVYARDGSIMGYLFREKRFLVNLEQMPDYLPKAFLAAEDARFFEHRGVDYKAIARAFVANVREGGTAQGGSTITQQLVKRLLLTAERSYKRKLKEAILAYRLESYLSKEQILYIYLNHIYLGNSSYGVEAAARTYFAKHVNELSLAEAAVLACLPQAPSRNNPYTQPHNTRERQLWVLSRMLEVGFISKEEHDAAVAQPLHYESMPDPSWTAGSWYLEEVRRQLIAFFDEENIKRVGVDIDIFGEDAVYEAGLHVYTAMDPVHQRASELGLRAGLHEADHRRGWRGPLEQLEPAEQAAFLRDNAFLPKDLDNAGWVKALVVKVDKDGADLRLGENYKGRISVKTMHWCRTPNPRVSAAAAGSIRDATKVLAPGDVVWVAAYGASGTGNPVSVPADPENKKQPVPAYDPLAVKAESVIPLTLEQIPDLQGALASIEVDSGDLVAIAGGYTFSPESQFNRATQARRQPGSSFKPIVYSAALDQGFTPGTILYDTPFVLPDRYSRRIWTPGNADGKFLGPMPLSRALAASRNVCTVRVAQQVGMEAIIRRAHDLGIPGDIPAVLAVSLGSYEATPLNMAEAYTAFANQGRRINPRLITSISNSWNEPLVRFNPGIAEAVTPQNAYVMAYLLKGVVSGGTGSAARVLGKPMGGKTGTSNEERDAWFIGFTPHLVTSVYVGYDNYVPMGRSEYGGKAALPIFIKYRQAVEPLYPPDDFAVPQGIIWSSGSTTEDGKTHPGFPYIAGIPPRYDSGGGGDELGEQLIK